MEALLCRSLFNSCELKMSFQRAAFRLIFGWETICAVAFYIDENPWLLDYMRVVVNVVSRSIHTFNPYMNFSFIASIIAMHTPSQSVGRPVGHSATPIDGVSSSRLKSLLLLAGFISSNMEFSSLSVKMATCLHSTVYACTVCTNRARLILHATHAARYNLL